MLAMTGEVGELAELFQYAAAFVPVCACVCLHTGRFQLQVEAAAESALRAATDRAEASRQPSHLSKAIVEHRAASEATFKRATELLGVLDPRGVRADRPVDRQALCSFARGGLGGGGDTGA